MKIDNELIQKVAGLARLNLTDSEIKKFTPELKDILDAFSKLDKVNTDKIRPSFQPVEIKDFMREDKIQPSLSQEQALRNSESKKDGYFKGPKAV
ncbi:MAG: Asp-tRNA(Asn)/Glu-tRNA(Gln) amidotransferase subunit GatC [Nanoarchaeota archaeon]